MSNIGKKLIIISLMLMFVSFIPINSQEIEKILPLNVETYLINDFSDYKKYGLDHIKDLPEYNTESLTEFHMPIVYKIPFTAKMDIERFLKQGLFLNQDKNFNDRILDYGYDIYGNLKPDEYFMVDYWLKIKASDKPFSVDFVPIIELDKTEYELKQYAWWNSSWSYSKSSYICNSVTDYQVKLTVGKTSGGDVNCSGNCQDDFDDIRFTKGDNITELHYWMENYTNGVQATFWINISDATTICMYYSNNAVSTTSNGINTFIYFDDWTTDNTGDWWSFREYDVSDDTSNNVYNITNGIGYDKRLRYRHTMSEWVTYTTGASFRVGFCSNEWDTTKQYPDDWIGTLTSTDTSDGSTAIIQAWDVYSDVDGTTSSIGYNDTDPFSSSAYYIRDFTILSDNATSKHYKNDGTLMVSAYQKDSAKIPPALDLDNIVMFTYVDTASSFFTHNAVDGELTVGGYRLDSKNVFSIDWMFLGEYVSTEPTFCNWSGEFMGIPCPTFIYTDVTPTHGSTTISYLIDNLSVTINSSTGLTFNYSIECSNGNTTSANNVGNGTYNLPVCCLEQETLYFWYVNVTHNVTCGWTNITYNFTTKLSGCLCTDELTAIIEEFKKLNENLEGDTVIVMDTTQFIILILIVLFCIFMWIGYIIPSLEGSTRSLHYIPFSGGLFVMFGALDFISLAILLTTNYSLGIIGGFLVTIGIILLIYGVLKAFYYE